MKLTRSMMSMRAPYHWWSTILWALGIFFGSSILTSFIAIPILVFASSITDINELMQGDYLFFLNMAVFPVTLMFLLLCNRYVYQHPQQALGFYKKDLVKKYGLGALIGIALIVIVFIFNLIAGAITTTFNPNHSVLMIIFMILAFGVQGLTEEVLARGFIMNKTAKQIGVPAAIIINSLFFSALHLLNPGVDAISTFNLFLAGVMFSLLFYWSDNIWLTGAAHSLWNIMLGVILGSEVSGMRLDHTLFITQFDQQHIFLNGGHFGFEGGIFTTIITLLFSSLLIYLIQKHHRNDI
ncbi:CPBP family intramembrane metalloprotease [Macrococcus hajekii]|uniref:CPBP family intramembrane metalloprotease n=1 Tax=Macrococcus hajekii TaxID=198482 RepID=A0A4R6BIY3_9STAP|nr:CPBP family intramembrane glutamic endopeptidase [Macrococcus hajekii]TDM01619.1 CPBP family intramembrane metalloprotease [Macrococcus hajekii]GGB01562.1 transporter [Macrococcus hajekii]